jgi:hypothetical protein
VIEAPTLFARLEHLVRDAAAYVALPGGNGTLVEIALAWEYLRRGLILPRPLVAWREPWQRIFQRLSDGPYLEGGTDLFTWVGNVEQAIEAVRAARPAAVPRNS